VGAPDGGAGSSQHGASTVVSFWVLGAGLRLHVRHWCRRHHGVRSRALRHVRCGSAQGGGEEQRWGCWGGSALRVASSRPGGGCLISGASRWAGHGSLCSRVLAVRNLPSLLCGESIPPRPALLPLALWPLGRSNRTAASMRCSDASGGSPPQEQCWRKRYTGHKCGSTP
jgi:hypothetical protein